MSGEWEPSKGVRIGLLGLSPENDTVKKKTA